MTEAVLLAVVLVPFLLLVAAAFYGHRANHRKRTITEVLVRWLFLVARWFEAQARATESAGIAYREHIATSEISDRLERFRPWQEEPVKRPALMPPLAKRSRA